MTVVAWDGVRMAADKLASTGGVASTVTKIYRIPEGLVGFAGDADHIGVLLQWFMGGRKADEFPDCAKEGSSSALFVDSNGNALIYSKTPWPLHEDEKFYAIGSGRDFALAAMHLGKSAVIGVKTAIDLSTTCGRGIDVLRLKK